MSSYVCIPNGKANGVGWGRCAWGAPGVRLGWGGVRCGAPGVAAQEGENDISG